MKLIFHSLVLLAASLTFTGCLTSPVSQTGGLGSVTVQNTNVNAIISAAQTAFAAYNYSVGPSNYPNSIAFDKRGGSRFANVMWGSYNNPQTIRCRVTINQIPGTNNFRLIPKVYSVSDAGEAGFDDQRPLMGLWNGEFGPILRQVAQAAGNAGPGY